MIHHLVVVVMIHLLGVVKVIYSGLTLLMSLCTCLTIALVWFVGASSCISFKVLVDFWIAWYWKLTRRQRWRWWHLKSLHWWETHRAHTFRNSILHHAIALDIGKLINTFKEYFLLWTFHCCSVSGIRSFFNLALCKPIIIYFEYYIVDVECFIASLLILYLLYIARWTTILLVLNLLVHGPHIYLFVWSYVLLLLIVRGKLTYNILVNFLALSLLIISLFRSDNTGSFVVYLLLTQHVAVNDCVGSRTYNQCLLILVSWF